MIKMTLSENKIKAPVNAGQSTFEIRGAETDYRDRLHLASLFVMMQEAAYRNAEDIGIGASSLDTRGVCWLLSKISVRMLRLPEWREKFHVTTWSRGASRLLFLRDFVFSTEHKDEKTPVGYAASEWFLADRDSHRPVRPEQIISQDGLDAYKNAPAVFDFSCPRLKNLELPDAADPILIKYADFSDIDRNGHVNNTRYVAWAIDTLQAWLAVSNNSLKLVDMTVDGVDIQYISEVFFGSKVWLYALPVTEDNLNDSCLLIEGRFGENQQTAFRCRVFFSKI